MSCFRPGLLNRLGEAETRQWPLVPERRNCRELWMDSKVPYAISAFSMGSLDAQKPRASETQSRGHPVTGLGARGLQSSASAVVSDPGSQLTQLRAARMWWEGAVQGRGLWEEAVPGRGLEGFIPCWPLPSRTASYHHAVSSSPPPGPSVLCPVNYGPKREPNCTCPSSRCGSGVLCLSDRKVTRQHPWAVPWLSALTPFPAGCRQSH